LALLSTLGSESSTWAASGYMVVLGVGLGMVMQVLVLAAQNAVDYRDLGVATSGTTLFRSIGGSVGVSLFGAIFSATLSADLSGTIPAAANLSGAVDPAAIQALPAAVRTAYLDAFTAALHPVFLAAAAVAALGFVLAWFLAEVPLRGPARDETIGESFAMPRDATSLEELERIVARLGRRENRWRAYQQIAEAADVPLQPDEIWLLVQLCHAPGPISAERLAGTFTQASPVLEEIGTRLADKAMAQRRSDGTLASSSRGRDAFSGWSPSDASGWPSCWRGGLPKSMRRSRLCSTACLRR